MQSMNNLVQPTQLPRGKKLTGMLVEKLKLNASGRPWVWLKLELTPNRDQTVQHFLYISLYTALSNT